MKDKETLGQRVSALGVNPDAIEAVQVYDVLPDTIPNAEGKRMSLQIYADITDDQGFITPEAARKGLSVFGEELRQETRATPEKHPNIERLELIASEGKTIRSDVVRRDSAKPIPDFVLGAIKEISKKEDTFYIYYGPGIRSSIHALNEAFSWSQGFRNYFAVKALSNPHIIRFVKKHGCGADCSSEPELYIAHNEAGMSGDDVFFSSNDTPAREFSYANRTGGIINLDDINHIDFLKKTLEFQGSLPETLCFRYNPGKERTGNAIIGNPEEAKYGLTKEQIFEAYDRMKKEGVKRFGLHTMVASNKRNPEYFVETARMLFALANEIHEKTGVKLDFVNLGGGIGIPYRPEHKKVDLSAVGEGIRKAHDEMIKGGPHDPLKIFMECGRLITGPHGYLVSKVRHVTKKHKDYVGLDACMADLMRPALYGAYHHITILGKENEPHDCVYDVTGSLCENNDKFAINRRLPRVESGDTAVLFDAGAHSYVMGFQYNGKLRHAEFLLPDNFSNAHKIRREETIDDYLRTVVPLNQVPH